jgi:hypothetical protein
MRTPERAEPSTHRARSASLDFDGNQRSPVPCGGGGSGAATEQRAARQRVPHTTQRGRAPPSALALAA